MGKRYSEKERWEFIVALSGILPIAGTIVLLAVASYASKQDPESLPVPVVATAFVFIPTSACGLLLGLAMALSGNGSRAVLWPASYLSVLVMLNLLPR